MTEVFNAFAPATVFIVLFGAARVTGMDRLRLNWRLASAAVIGILIAIAAAYTSLPVLLEDTETNIACVATLVMHGQPMYPAPDSAARYILLYGPVTYLARLVFFPLLGTNLIAFKLAGLLALLTSLLFAYRIVRAYANRAAGLIGTGAYALILFRFLAASMWGRCDPFLVCAATVGVWAALRGRWLSVAIACAALVDLKITAIAYALPVYALLFVSARRSRVAVSAALAVVLALAPFLLPQISLRHYLFALSDAGRHGLEWQFALRNLEYAGLLLLPISALLLSGSRMKRSQKICLAAICAGLLLSSLAGAKVGAGSYHLLPQIGALLQFFFWLHAEVPQGQVAFRRFAVAWTLTWLVFSVKEIREVEQAFASVRGAHSIDAEIRSVMASNPGRVIEAGVGDRYEDPRARYAFVTTFHGEPYTLSYSTLRDLQLGGVPMPQATLNYISSCKTQIWLIPRGQKPFAAPNTYFDSYRSAFGPISRIFAARYHKVESLPEYDVWACGPINQPFQSASLPAKVLPSSRAANP